MNKFDYAVLTNNNFFYMCVCVHCLINKNKYNSIDLAAVALFNL